MKITDEYRNQNIELHASNNTYGAHGGRWAAHVLNLCVKNNTNEVLDYGCGKATLNLHMPFGITCYDPAVKKYAAEPEPHDVVVCTDVLEHVEPDCLPDVLDDLRKLTKKQAFINVATREAKKTLPDGRNAHLIVEDADWWMEQINQRFEVNEEVERTEGDFTFIATPKEAS